MTGKITDGAVRRIHEAGLSVLWGEMAGERGLSSRVVGVGEWIANKRRQKIRSAGRSDLLALGH